MIYKTFIVLLAAAIPFICLVAVDNLSEYFEYVDELGLAILLATLVVRIEELEEKLKKK